MTSIQIDLSCAGESKCDRAGGWGFRGQSSDKGQRRRAKKQAAGSIWARSGGMIYAKAADIPPPFSSTCFLKRSEKLETARKEQTLYSRRGP